MASLQTATYHSSVVCVCVAGEPGERGEGGPQTGGQHDPPGGEPAPDQGCDCESESGPRGHGTQKRYNCFFPQCHWLKVCVVKWHDSPSVV